MTLPIGYEPIGEGIPGIQRGAPKAPRLWIKTGVTTILTSLIFLLLYLYVPADMLQWGYFQE